MASYEGYLVVSVGLRRWAYSPDDMHWHIVDFARGGFASVCGISLTPGRLHEPFRGQWCEWCEECAASQLSAIEVPAPVFGRDRFPFPHDHRPDPQAGGGVAPAFHPCVGPAGF